MKASGIFSVSGYDDIGQHLIPNSTSVPKEQNKNMTYVICNNIMSSDMHTRKEWN